MTTDREPWIDQFLDGMLRTQVDKEALLRSMEIKDQHVPAKLYRYRSFDPAGRTFENLENDLVWLNPANKFNDPFDSQFSVSHSKVLAASTRKRLDKTIEVAGLRRFLTDEDIREIRDSDEPLSLLSRKVAPRPESATPEQMQQVLSAIDALIDKLAKEPFAALMEHVRSNFALCCFIPDNGSVLMWGHYAQQHEGICLEYDFGALPPGDIRRRMTFPVIYSPRLFDATPHFLEWANTGTGSPFLGIMSALFKAPDWSYEKEWRFISPFGPQLYPMPTPTAVYLGLKMSPANRKRVEEICSRRNIRVVPMTMADGEFRMRPVET